MNLRDLMLKAKTIGVDGPRGKESRKRKIADGSASTHSGSQSLPPPHRPLRPRRFRSFKLGVRIRRLRLRGGRRRPRFLPRVMPIVPRVLEGLLLGSQS
ncbi:TonB-dependent hemoglobin/transferrin/lactoferrin family receptor [Sesbania bispinosa]|nr:TonB-dependent hemoglobin/transferrin/lactoferrin family receptor [Sesbania bispinosa]